MCQKCFDFANKLFGPLSDKDLSDLFWSATSFPGGTHENIRQQLQKHYDAGARTVKDAMDIAHKNVTEQLAEIRKEREEKK